MAGTKEIKRRIKSVKSTKKITKAMELVSASKMRRAVSKTLSSRLYATYSWELLTSLSDRLENISHPFFSTDESKNKNLIVLVTSTRGLCGGYDSQIIKKTILALKNEIGGEEVDFVTVGKKGDNAMRRTGQNVVATFLDIPDNFDLREISPLSYFITNEFLNGPYKKIYIAYTDFVSALTQKPKIRQILPISKEEFKETIEENFDIKLNHKKDIPYLLEGDIHKLLNQIAEKLTKMQIYQMLLESNASEQSARMMAMKNASEAANEMIDDLTLMFNKARQASITREISEISGGMAALS